MANTSLANYLPSHNHLVRKWLYLFDISFPVPLWVVIFHLFHINPCIRKKRVTPKKRKDRGLKLLRSLGTWLSLAMRHNPKTCPRSRPSRRATPRAAPGVLEDRGIQGTQTAQHLTFKGPSLSSTSKLSLRNWISQSI